jgi:hypothetical protein
MHSSDTKTTYTLAATMADLANLADGAEAVSQFLGKHRDYLYQWNVDVLTIEHVKAHVFNLRSKIRTLWRGGEKANQIALEFLLAKKDTVLEYETGSETIAFSPDAIKVNWDNGNLELDYHALDDFQASIYALLKLSRFLKVCACPGCPHPHFVAKDLRARHCSLRCSNAMQNKWRREWWEEHGKKWRENRKVKGKRKRKKGKK